MGRAVRVIVDHLAKELNLPLRTGRKFIERFLEEIEHDLVYTGRSEIRGLGIFATEDRPAHKTRHPKTGEPVEIPDRKTVRYRSSIALRRKLNP
jgi:integration host factor subunit beta